MARDLIHYNNFYKKPEEVLDALVRSGWSSNEWNKFRLSQPVVCADFVDLAQSIVGAHLTTSNTEPFGTGVLPSSIKEGITTLTCKSHRWACLVFLTRKGSESVTLKTYRHKRTGLLRINEYYENVSEQDIIDGYSGGHKLSDALEKDLTDPDKWIEDSSIHMTNNRAVFFRADMPISIPKNYYDSGVLQLFIFGDDNAN
jgi:hypothetical protein